jgi:2-polyprenyl-3-methyl-5-hydroxy-6-metoxy-1,4-benzoquinol methylase
MKQIANAVRSTESKNIMKKFTGEYFLPGKTEQRIEKDHLARYDFALNFIEQKSVLDLACGEGYASNILMQKAKKYVGVDLNENLIEHAKHKYIRDNVTFVTGNAETYSGKELHDVIISFETIEHVPNFNDVFKTYYRNLRSGGLLLVSTPNRKVTSPNAIKLTDKPNNPYHTQEFLLNEIVTIAKKHEFNVQQVYGQRQSMINGFPSVVRRLFNKLGVRMSSLGSSTVSTIKNEPRYLILVCEKE